MNYMEQAMQGSLEKQTALVLSNTWGHLFPTVKYSEGEVIIMTNDHNVTSIYQYDIQDMDCSPWLQDAVFQFLDDVCKDDSNTEPCTIFKFKVSAIVETILDGYKGWTDEDFKEELDVNPDFEPDTCERIVINSLLKIPCKLLIET